MTDPRPIDEDLLLVRLRALPPGAPGPAEPFRSELRQQMVAVTRRVINESAAERASSRPSPSPRPSPSRHAAPASAGRARHVRRSWPARLRRPLVLLPAFVAIFAVLLGVAVWQSGRAIPGDSLYGLKRTSEGVRLSLAGGSEDRGRAYLSLAGNRASEADTMLTGAVNTIKAGRTVSQHVLDLWFETMNNTDSDSRDATQLLSTATVINSSATPIGRVSSWLPAQQAKVNNILSLAPAGPLRTRAATSIALLKRIDARVAALKSGLSCKCLSVAVTDDLGPVPCTTNCATKPPTSPTPTPTHS